MNKPRFYILIFLFLIAGCSSTPQLTRSSVSEIKKSTQSYWHGKSTGLPFGASYYNASFAWHDSDLTHTSDGFAESLLLLRPLDSLGKISPAAARADSAMLLHMLNSIILTAK